MSARHTPMEPAVLGGFIIGMDFGREPHGSLEIGADEGFRAALGRNARVLIVPDGPEYRVAPALADALQALLAVTTERKRDPFKYEEAIENARAALRAAGRLGGGGEK